MEDNKRKISEAIKYLSQAFNDNSNTQALIKANSIMQKIMSNYVVSAASPIRADMIEDIDTEFIPSGVDWFDERLAGGLRKEELLLIGATPSAGKTHLMCWIVAQYVKAGGIGVHLIGEDIVSDIRDYYDKALGSKKLLKRVYLADMSDYRYSIREVESIIDKLKKDHIIPDIVAIDHLDIMNPPYSMRTGEEEKTHIIRDMRLFAKRHKVICVTASQAHEKSSERKGFKRFYGSTIGKAGNADVIMLVDAIYESRYRLILEKTRGRPRLSEEGRIMDVVVDWDNMTIEEV